MNTIKLSDSWMKHLKPEFSKHHMKSLKFFLNTEYKANKIIYPQKTEYFKALDLVPLNKVKVVILGQDPYHGPDQAHGLCFSVSDGIAFPPSLKNIFKELHSDLGVEIPKSGNLERWGRQGVLLLNSVLTVEKDQPASHQKQGWEQFTDRIIEVVNQECNNVVFILWGSYAQKKASFVNQKKHLVIQAVHPSPLSSYRGFFGSKPFSTTNRWLLSKNLSEIIW